MLLSQNTLLKTNFYAHSIFLISDHLIIIEENIDIETGEFKDLRPKRCHHILNLTCSQSFKMLKRAQNFLRKKNIYIWYANIL